MIVCQYEIIEQVLKVGVLMFEIYLIMIMTGLLLK